MVRVERRQALADALADLRRYASENGLDRFLGTRDVQRLVMHALYVAVQACIDEAMEACRDRRLGEVQSYRDAFRLLGEAGIIDPALASSLSDWASFRNVLAHFYPVVDLRRVWAALDDLDELERFQRDLSASDLERGGSGP